MSLNEEAVWDWSLHGHCLRLIFAPEEIQKMLSPISKLRALGFHILISSLDLFHTEAVNFHCSTMELALWTYWIFLNALW